MATDKSLNLRQLKAAEETAAAIEEIKQMLVLLSGQVEALTAAQGARDVAKPAAEAGAKTWQEKEPRSRK
jgi:hypothetical protein